MARPTDRDSFKEYCLRKLGKGAITINVTDDQVDDRVDEAIEMFNLYHYEGFFKTYIKHELTQDDIDTMSIPIASNVQDVVSMFDLGRLNGSSSNIFEVAYQTTLVDMAGLRGQSNLSAYYMARMHVENVHKMLTGASPIRFHSTGNRVYIDLPKSRLRVGMYVVFEAYLKVDPDIEPDAWRNVWLQNYTTAKIKYQWGSNLSKHIGVPLPGNIQMNAEIIMSQADEEIRRLEEELREKLAPGAYDLIG